MRPALFKLANTPPAHAPPPPPHPPDRKSSLEHLSNSLYNVAIPAVAVGGLYHLSKNILHSTNQAYLGTLAAGALGTGLLGYGAYRALQPSQPSHNAYPYPYPPPGYGYPMPYPKYASLAVPGYTLSMRPLSFEKRALLRGSLRSFGNYAARNPDDALALTHALDQAAKGGLKGALIGGAGGYAIAPEGEEEDMALRGALLGGGLNAVRRGYQAGDEFSDALRDPAVRARMSGRLRDLQSGGALLGRAMGDGK